MPKQRSLNKAAKDGHPNKKKATPNKRNGTQTKQSLTMKRKKKTLRIGMRNGCLRYLYIFKSLRGYLSWRCSISLV